MTGWHRLKLAIAICVTAAVVLLLILTACASTSGPSDKDVLIGLTDEVILPAYQQLAEESASMKQSVETLCSAPTAASLENARESWRAARAAWMRSEAMWFGPVMDRRSTSLLDWSPTDTTGIDRLLVGGAPATVEEIRDTLGSNRRGFGAMEYILYTSNALANPGQAAPICPFLVGLSTVVYEESSAILAEWVEGTEGRPAYDYYFSDRAGVSMLPSAAVAEVVRSQFFLIRDIVDVRLASAMGLRDDPADLSVIPGNAADNGLQDIRNELLGMRAIYQGSGKEGVGISHLVAQLSEDTDTRLRVQFDAAFAAIDAVNGPFRDAVAQPTTLVQTLYDRLSDVQRTIGTEVVSLLGVSIGFTDTDGDSLR